MIYIFSGFIFLGWLIPNHYPPWNSAWNDFASITGLLLLAIYRFIFHRNPQQFSIVLLVFFGLIITLPWLQLLAGHLAFLGDALMVSLYAAYTLLSVILGKSFSQKIDFSSNKNISILIASCVLAAICSTGIALVQWTGSLSLGIYGAELPPGSRPFGNVAQPNHLNTLCFLGICCLFWLYENNIIRKKCLWICLIFLLIGMLLSQSRTGWLQIGFLFLFGSIQYLRTHNRISINWLLAICIIFSIGVISWHPINEFLLLNPGRDISSQIHPGARPAYWLSMLDALYQNPWWGYGWQQIGAAQQNIALNHPPSAAYFEHSHNLILDLMLWNGIPIGVLLAALFGIWLIKNIKSYKHPDAGWLLAAIMGLGIHGLLEFPLEYAYFLIPAGLFIGFIEASTPQTTRLVVIPYRALVGGTAVIIAISVLVAHEWLTAETDYRDLRLESAGIGEVQTVNETAHFRLLTQLGAFLVFARTEATPDMPAEQVEWMRLVAMRFGYPPVMFRYALAAGLHDNPLEATITLQRICRIHGAQRCTEAQEGWKQLQQRFPKLQAVPSPISP